MSNLFKTGLCLIPALLLAALLGGLVARSLPAPVPAAPAGSEPAAQSAPPTPAVQSMPEADDAGRLQEQFASVIERALPAVVLITAQRRVGVVDPYFQFRGRRRIDYLEIPSGQGSGFFVRADGYVLTNFHVVRDQDSFWVTLHDGTEYPARVVGADPPTDLALLKLEAPGKQFPVLHFAAPETLRIGHWAIAIGAPFNLSRTVTIGIVSNLKRSGVGVNLQENYVQTDASINPGNSGGPLLNLRGEVIGVNDFILSPSGGNIGLSFAISSEIADRITAELIESGHIERPWLGAVLEPLGREARRQLSVGTGVRVAQIFRNSPAAGLLHPGDVIQKANGQQLESPDDLQNCVFRLEPGAKLKLELVRDGRPLEVEATLSRSPANWYRLRPREGQLYVHAL